METNTTPTIQNSNISRGVAETNRMLLAGFWSTRASQEDQAARLDPYAAVGSRRQARHYRCLAKLCRGI